MKHLCALLFFVSCVLPAFSQCQPQELRFDSIEFRRNYEFSGVAFTGDTLWLPAEKCNTLLVCKVDEKGVVSLRHKLHTGLPDGAAIEGICRMGDHFLMCDEGILPHTCRLWDYNFRTGKLRALAHDSKALAICAGGEYGIEGIAYNPEDSVCYVLQERTDTLHSDVFVFRVHSMGDSIYLEQKAVAQIALSGLYWRYADIYYDTASHSLLCLQSYYDAQHKESAAYNLDKVPVAAGGIQLSAAMQLCALTGFVRPAGMQLREGIGVANNTEGVVIHDGWLYIVSDNKSSAGCTLEFGKWPLFFRIPDRF